MQTGEIPSYDLSRPEPLIDEFKQQNTKAVAFQKVYTPKIIELSDTEVAYGIFLYSIKGESIRLKGMYRSGVFEYLKHKGYFKRYGDVNSYILIHDIDNIISEVEISQIQDELTNYIKSIDKPVSFKHKQGKAKVRTSKLLETWHNNVHLICNKTALGSLENHLKPVLSDTEDESFFPFHNYVVKCTSAGLTSLEYDGLQDVCVWKEHIISRKCRLSNNHQIPKCHFADFITNIAAGSPDRIKGFRSAIGYLLHSYSSSSQRIAVIAYDEEITDAQHPQGGTGKGIVAQAIRLIRRTSTIDGKKFDPSDRFCFQQVDERCQVAFFDDVKKDFDFSRLNSIITEGWQIENKNKPTYKIDPKHGPKIYISSNSILKGEGTTIERRQFILEFSPFYSLLARMKIDPIVATHGCQFFEEKSWDEQEWDNFHHYMMFCVQEYLQNGLFYPATVNLKINKLRQRTSEDFAKWIMGKYIQSGTEYKLDDWIIEFREFSCTDESEIQMKQFKKWLKSYAETNSLEYSHRRSNHINYCSFTQQSHKAT